MLGGGIFGNANMVLVPIDMMSKVFGPLVVVLILLMPEVEADCFPIDFSSQW